jgi:CheY-like chemotaxis protein
MQPVLDFIAANRPLVDAVHVASSLVNLVAWVFGAIVLIIAWRRNAVRSFAFGPVRFQLQEAAVEATAVAARSWSAQGGQVDVARIRKTVSLAFEPQMADMMMGRSVLWVDDHPDNNMLAMRALKTLKLDVEQVTSTDAAMEAMKRRRFDLVISDMGRGLDMRAGYDLLDKVRANDRKLPFFIFSSDDKPEYRKEAEARGAQLSTNDMIELIDMTVQTLGRG